uniref:Uncharacterized protein n=1 Tax=Romanomermis culicivorax TaxID=13658 RepID=A0A915JC83_ROMCU
MQTGPVTLIGWVPPRSTKIATTSIADGGIARTSAVGTLSPATCTIVGATSMEGAHLKMCPQWAIASVLDIHRQLCSILCTYGLAACIII